MGNLLPLYPRPRTRGDCASVPRPCPWVSCRHHLYLDVRRNGFLSILHPNKEPGEMVESCSLDVADRGESLDINEIAALLNLTHASVWLSADEAHQAVRASELSEHVDGDFRVPLLRVMTGARKRTEKAEKAPGAPPAFPKKMNPQKHLGGLGWTQHGKRRRHVHESGAEVRRAFRGTWIATRPDGSSSEWPGRGQAMRWATRVEPGTQENRKIKTASISESVTGKGEAAE